MTKCVKEKLKFALHFKKTNNRMKIVFMGTPEFAVPSLDILVKSGYDIVGVVTATDKLGGRGGKQLIQSAVKQYRCVI